MKRLLFVGIILFLTFARCAKSSDHYYKEFLDQAESAKLGMVDSLQILPGFNRAKLKFIVPPDRRVEQIKIVYTTSLSADPKEIYKDLDSDSYGNTEEIMLTDLPEAVITVTVLSTKSNETSNPAIISSRIYGNQYVSNLSNRIFTGFTGLGADRKLNLLQESGLPQDPSVFTVMQRTEIIYSASSGSDISLFATPYDRVVALNGVANSGTLRFRTIYKPQETAFDEFMGPWTIVQF